MDFKRDHKTNPKAVSWLSVIDTSIIKVVDSETRVRNCFGEAGFDSVIDVLANEIRVA